MEANTKVHCQSLCLVEANLLREQYNIVYTHTHI